MEDDFDSAGSSDYSLVGRIYRSKSLPDGDFSRLDDFGQNWDSGVGSDCFPQVDGEFLQQDFPSGEVESVSGVLGSENQSACTCEEQQQPDSVKVIIAKHGKVLLNATDQKLQELRTLKQHYYPEGGWGWLVVVVACLVHLLVNGSQIVLATIIVSFGKPNTISRRLHPDIYSSSSKLKYV